MALTGRIITINCGCGSEQRPASRDEKIDSIAKLCSELEPQIILLQEFDCNRCGAKKKTLPGRPSACYPSDGCRPCQAPTAVPLVQPETRFLDLQMCSAVARRRSYLRHYLVVMAAGAVCSCSVKQGAECQYQ